MRQFAISVEVVGDVKIFLHFVCLFVFASQLNHYSKGGFVALHKCEDFEFLRFVRASCTQEGWLLEESLTRQKCQCEQMTLVNHNAVEAGKVPDKMRATRPV